MPTRALKKLNLLTLLGSLLVLGGLLVLASYFYPVGREEVKYALRQSDLVPPKLEPVNTEFSILIPKLGANAPLVADVDPLNSSVYQRALSRGVAHAAGTGKPGEGTNIFLFAHSSADFTIARRYNSVFYLIHKLEPGDLITVWYQNQEFDYSVTDKRLVYPDDTQYLTSNDNVEILTLMTCWPPGTTLKRLIVTAKPITD